MIDEHDHSKVLKRQGAQLDEIVERLSRVRGQLAKVGDALDKASGPTDGTDGIAATVRKMRRGVNNRRPGERQA